MKKAILAVCDVEEAYARSFLDYLHTGRRKKLPFELQAFTSAEQLLAFAKEHEIEILLISEHAMCEEVRALQVGKLIILADGADRPGLEIYPRVYKYQASDQVIREVLDFYGAEKLARFTPVHLKHRMRVTGVYSPGGFSQRMLFALTLGQILAAKQQVLYIGLDSYSGLGEMLSLQGGRTLSDLLYHFRRGKPLAMAHTDRIVCPLRRLDCVPPAVSPADIRDISGEEWIRFLEELMQAGGYEEIVLDIGDVVRDVPELLNSCQDVFLPSGTDVLSSARIRQFEESIREAYPSLAGRMKKIYPPLVYPAFADRSLLESLCDGELGEYVRKAAWPVWR